MSSTIVKKENNNVTLKIEVSSETFEKAIQKSYLKNRGRFNIPGFRKGKTPRKIIESRYGVEVFYEDAVNFVLPDAYDKAIEEHDLKPVDRPEIDIEELEKDKPVVFKVDITVKPEVKLGEYKGIEAEKVEYNVTEEDVEAELKNMQERNSRLIAVEYRAAKEGDTVVIDYEGYVGDEQFEGGTAENQTLELGSNTFIPGFEEQLVGKNVEDDVDVKVTFPEEYHSEELAGKEAIFKVKIHEVKEKELPALDDEFAKDVSEFDTLEELKADLKKKMEDEAEQKEKNETQSKVIEKVLEGVEVDIPEAMIEAQIDSEIKNFEYRLLYQGLNMEKYLSLTNTKIEDLREQIKPTAENFVKTDLVLEAISKAEEIEVTEEEVEKELAKLAKQYDQDLDKFKKNMRDEDLEYIKMGIIKSKTVDMLVDNAKLV
ncbi:trigger factor [Clostridiisalibacter paucivorans]|uniref:trigger factor n=1 Tax=Clostridiisalibacter paucivorans TaxID=408753 RepID=UPI00047BFAEB|nr:trigger factor [Clostridiisalibacter paucivorans]